MIEGIDSVRVEVLPVAEHVVEALRACARAGGAAELRAARKPREPRRSMTLRAPLRASFQHVVAAVYTVGTVFHLVRIAVRLDLRDMPYFPDVLILLLGSWGAVGMLVFTKEVQFRGTWELVVHWLIVFHLVMSVALHAWILYVQSHAAVAIFSIGYSYFGAAYFAFFAWRSWTMRLTPPAQA